MNRIILANLIFIFCNSIVFSQGTLQINTNVEMVMSGNVHLVVNEMDMTNDGTIEAGTQSKVAIISAATPSTIAIEGTGTTEFHQLEINTTDQVMLSQNILVNDTLNFESGELDVNGFSINFGLNGNVVSETNGQSIIGQTGGTIQASANIAAPTQLNPANLGMMITSTANFGSTTIARGHVPFTNGGDVSIERYYDISAANNTGLNATLRFHYLDHELNGLDESDLELYRSTDGGTTWTNEGFDSRNTTENWVEKSGIDGFSIWTLSKSSSSLPVELFSFSADCAGEKTILNWATASELNNDLFEIQKSKNGTDWISTGTVLGNGTATQTNYYRFESSEYLSYEYYRLKQIDFDGKFSYSDIIRSNCWKNDDLEISVFPNPATDNISVSFPDEQTESLDLKLVNSLGQIMEERTIDFQNGNPNITFSLTHLSDGVYELMVIKKSGTQSIRVFKTQE